jgi:hypothetical protein
MKHKQRPILQTIFARKVSGNLDPRQVSAMLEVLGGEATHGAHGHIVVRLNGHTHGSNESRHATAKDDIAALRKFLETAGIDPARDVPPDRHAA